VQRFLITRVLKPIKEKHGVNYTIEEQDGVLQAIRLTGTLNNKTLDELKGAVAWTLEKASHRERTQAEQPAR